MTDKQQDEVEHKNWECRVCGQLFVGMAASEYGLEISRHILDNHRDQPIDKPLVVPMGEANV